jgi:signal transduction histidine kinase
MKKDHPPDQTAQAITNEWIVTVLRWVVLLVFFLIRGFTGAQHQFYLDPLYYLILLGALYNLYVTYVLYTGEVNRNLPHYISFFLVTDILLLVSLVVFSSIHQSGLLLFYFFLIIIVALRASFRLSLILGPIMIAAYLVSLYLVEGSLTFSLKRLSVDVLGLLLLSAACGWFSEGRTRAWQTVYQMDYHLKKTRLDLEDTRDQLELLRRLDEFRRDFIAVMSHEFHTPLTAIIGYADLMLMGEGGPLTDRQRTFLSEMLEKSQDLLGLIDNLLDLSKVQSGRWFLKLEPIHPRKLVEKVIEPRGAHAKKRGIEIVHPPSPHEPLPEIPVDREKIERLLSNLVDNALKFTPSGGRISVTEEVGIDPRLEEYFPHLITSTDVITFRVADTGPGIPEKDRERIFDRFYHAHGEDLRGASPGAGLGLSISKEIVELHWGKIWYEPSPEGGSVLCFTLPVKPLRLRRRIALFISEFNLVPVLNGLLLQFQGEIDRRKLFVRREGFSTSTDDQANVRADRQLLQSVIFNILNNQIRYASPGSEVYLGLEVDRDTMLCIITIRSQGEALRGEIIDGFRSGGVMDESAGPADLRRANVNLILARDIIESHGGSLTLENIDDRGVLAVISLPMDIKTREGEMENEAEKDTDRRR